jgi:asparagine synthase (glutamine-hydrolysing)
MCGIAGAICSESGETVARMTAALAHRGPDGDGFYHDNEIALGHRRLAIIDVEGGRQPITNEDGSLVLLCNGEIYNSPQLRQELAARGHHFKTATDVEVILHLYEDHGRDCVEHLRGMFAFAIWDKAASTLFLARDHLGQKPLFYYHDSTRFFFASEIKGILASGAVAAELDMKGLWHLLSLRYVPDGQTLYRAIKRVPAATTILLKEGKLSAHRYWTPDFHEKRDWGEAEAVERLDGLLRETVDLHMLSDVPVGAFLSSGIDCSTLACLASMRSSGPLPVFSIGSEQESFNELPVARVIAGEHGMQLHEQIVRPDVLGLVPEMVRHMDGPADPFGLGVYYASRLAKGDVKVVLGGDGGDEVFGGYDRYMGQMLVDLYCRLPRGLRGSVIDRLIARLPETFEYKSLAQRLAWLSAMSTTVGGRRYAESVFFLRFNREVKERLFTPNARALVEEADSADAILAHFDSRSVGELVDRMLYADLMATVPDLNTTITDHMSMAWSVEVRSPYLDHQVVEFAARLPARHKVKLWRLKHILRRVAARYLPGDVSARPKQGFGFPLGMWIKGDLQKPLRRMFADSFFVRNGIFDGAYLQQILDQHMSAQSDHSHRIWLLFNLEIWARLALENQTSDQAQAEVRRLMAG